ncbi:hypothetical protein CHS0354_011926, partial [Potamilus streckersoni]
MHNTIGPFELWTMSSELDNNNLPFCVMEVNDKNICNNDGSCTKKITDRNVLSKV